MLKKLRFSIKYICTKVVNVLQSSESLKYFLLRCKFVIALVMVFGLVGRQSMVGSGDPGEFGEHGSLCFKLPEILSILCTGKLRNEKAT